MALKALEIQRFRGEDKPYRKADEKGLYLEVFPNDSKLWRWKYRFGGKEKRLALGAYPEVTLAMARESRDTARAVLREGRDPGLERKVSKANNKLAAGNTFALVAEDYIDGKMAGDGRAPATINKARWFLEQLRPAIGNMPIDDVEAQMLLAALKRVEARGHYETAKKCRSFASRVFRYGVVTGRCKADPAALLAGALITPKARHYAAILEPTKLGAYLRAAEGYDGSPLTRWGLCLLAHVFVRPGELTQADWSEIDLDKRIWSIPAARTKSRRAHELPLSDQVVAIFRDIYNLTGPNGFVFPAMHTRLRPMSENTLNAALRRMGFGKDEVTSHGFRSTASTMLNETGLWNSDAIEKALSHRDKDAVRAIYNRGSYWDERVRMAQWWSDYLTAIRDGGRPAG